MTLDKKTVYQEIMKKCPGVTREQLDKMGESDTSQDLDLNKWFDDWYPEKTQINPTAKAILKRKKSDAAKVVDLINLFYQDHPTAAPEPELDHPAFFATRGSFRDWLLVQLGGDPLDYWSMVYKAARTWFPGPDYPKALHAFCASMESHSCTFCWHEREGFRQLLDDLLNWKATKNLGSG